MGLFLQYAYGLTRKTSCTECSFGSSCRILHCNRIRRSRQTKQSMLSIIWTILKHITSEMVILIYYISIFIYFPFIVTLGFIETLSESFTNMMLGIGLSLRCELVESNVTSTFILDSKLYMSSSYSHLLS